MKACTGTANPPQLIVVRAGHSVISLFRSLFRSVRHRHIYRDGGMTQPESPAAASGAPQLVPANEAGWVSEDDPHPAVHWPRRARPDTVPGRSGSQRPGASTTAGWHLASSSSFWVECQRHSRQARPVIPWSGDRRVALRHAVVKAKQT